MEMTISLNAPGMTALHQAGLAGLYMTLKAFDESGQSIDGLSWSLEDNFVQLNWTGDDKKASINELANKSFWLDNGFIRLAGLEINSPPSIEQKHLLYTALLNSFLQFGPHRPTENKRTLSYEIDERPIYIKEFAPIKSFRHQDVAKDFVGEDGNFLREVEAAGWLYPGGGQRHVAYGSTKLNEPLELALALLFAPVGVVYYVVKSRAKGRKTRLAMLIPQINNLAEYSYFRCVLATHGEFDMTASSSSDAVLRMLTAIKANKVSNEYTQVTNQPNLCRVITFGIVSWNEKQKSRTSTRTIISGRLAGLDNYRKAHLIFQNRLQRIAGKKDRKGKEIQPERFFVTTLCARELIANNIAEGKPWYHDISTFLSNKDVRDQIVFERKELNHMVETATFDDERERLFISVFHESWRRRLGRLGDRAASERASFPALVTREAEKVRTSLS
ncbi:MAG: type I-MYXAN CRISPR-associated Cas8a1/Cmx1, partial [Cyanobacteria bacterium]|nr:type I-MYXAN CRISPR-associated Cas8a1/Cmx1 [Cyanobacteriota bacterium]